jgi:hypothetical protein
VRGCQRFCCTRLCYSGIRGRTHDAASKGTVDRTAGWTKNRIKALIEKCGVQRDCELFRQFLILTSGLTNVRVVSLRYGAQKPPFDPVCIRTVCGANRCCGSVNVVVCASMTRRKRPLSASATHILPRRQRLLLSGCGDGESRVYVEHRSSYWRTSLAASRWQRGHHPNMALRRLAQS